MDTVWVYTMWLHRGPQNATNWHAVSADDAGNTEGTVVQRLIHYTARKWLQHTATQKQ